MILSNNFYRLETENEIHNIIKYMPRSSIFLEIGVGTGRLFIPIIQKRNPHLAVGLDIKRHFLVKLKQKIIAENLHSDVNLVVGSIYNLPFRDKVFNISLLAHVLMYVRDYKTALKEVVRVSNYRIIDISPYIVSVYGFIVFPIYLLRKLLGKSSHLHYFYPNELKHAFSELNVKSLKEHPVIFVPSIIFVPLPSFLLKIAKIWEDIFRRRKIKFIEKFYAYKMLIVNLSS